MKNKVSANNKELISNLKSGEFNHVNIYEFIKNYRFEYIYALIEGFNNNLDLNLMHLLVCELNSLYNCPSADSWQEAEDLISLYTYLGLYSEMAIIKDYYNMIDLWNSRLTEIYKDMLIKIKEICLENEEKTSIILKLYSSLSIKLEEEKGPVKKLTNSNAK